MNDEREVKIVCYGQVARDVSSLLRCIEYCFVLLVIDEPGKKRNQTACELRIENKGTCLN